MMTARPKTKAVPRKASTPTAASKFTFVCIDCSFQCKALCAAKWESKKICAPLLVPLAHGTNQGFHMIEILFESIAPRFRQLVFSLRRAPLERFSAQDVASVFQFSCVYRE